jgi:predicted HTH domain antitoxin
MAQESTLHVKVEPQVARGLKALAHKRHQTVGELVREAVMATFQSSLQGLTISERQAMEAYRGGYISLGKLAQAMGLSVLDMRRWLTEHDIPQNSSFGQEDAENA